MSCHSVYCIQFHLVFCVKYRRKVLTDPISERLKSLVVNIASNFGIRIIEQETDKDHIHILFASKPSVTLSKFINSLKSVTSRMIRKKGLGHNIGHSVGWVERSETQQLIGVGFRSSTQPTKNSDGLKYDQGRKEFPEIRKELWGKAFWSPSYFLASVGQVTLSDVKKYVENQGKQL